MESGGQAPIGGNAEELPADSGGQPPTVLKPIATSASTMGLLMYGGLILRVAAFVFSLISFSVMASNKGFFDTLEGFSYVLAACVISAVYTLLQNVRKIYHLSTGNSLFEACTSNLVDFVGDQDGQAFFPLALSAILSGYKLSTKTYT
ncbi:hypothetical protein MKX01_031724 [Papaver californicum]|nr:hypothetical protein MKX01_031724 [Papaver californicum]